MKYNAIKNKYLAGAILSTLTALFGIVACGKDWIESFPDLGLNIYTLVCAFAAILLGIVCLVLYLKAIAYALIKDDGIHIFSRKQGELLFIPWEEAKDFRWFPGADRSADYMMLIFDWNAQFCGKPLPGYQGYPRPNPKKAKPYLLDSLMEKLALGQITTDEIKEMPFFLLISKKRINEQYYAMWKAARTEEP